MQLDQDNKENKHLITIWYLFINSQLLWMFILSLAPLYNFKQREEHAGNPFSRIFLTTLAPPQVLTPWDLELNLSIFLET